MQLTELKGIGVKTRDTMDNAGIHDVMDLLFFFPRDYELFQAPDTIGEIGCRPFATLRGVFVQGVFERKVKNLTISQVTFRDEIGATLRVVWFNSPYIKKSVQAGVPCVVRGRINRRYGALQMEQPRVYTLAEYDALQGNMQPVYPLTKGLTNALMIRSVRQALESPEYARIDEEEMIPQEVRRTCGLCSRSFAVRNLHFPQSRESYIEARKRMAFEEIFLFIYGMRMSGAGRRPETDYVIPYSEKTEAFIKALPFALTKAQEAVIQQIREDLSSGTATNRLIQGDVGSGKTIVALTALMDTALAGYQGALMAPTEVLAEQHYRTITELFARYEVPLHAALLTGSMTALEKQVVYQALEDGKIDLLIGTHALIQEKVSFKDLALAVIDEQHRFGTRQRRTLTEKGGGREPHLLVMSATPIPRTLALILYGDMDVSVIDQVPATRKPIKNAVVDDSYRDNAWRFLTKQVQMGHQVYVVCPLVEYSEGLDAANVEDQAEMLRHVLPPSIRIGKLTGPMPPAQKREVMERFAEGRIDVLVCTTVVEVGVDVPNATVILVEDANRFGLAALHQLRGRVGRGDAQSYCIFFSNDRSPEAMKRLEILRESNNGFEIAAKDLELRGPGELMGLRQSGELAFQNFDLYTDAPIALMAQEQVERILDGNAGVTEQESERLEQMRKMRQSRLIL